MRSIILPLTKQIVTVLPDSLPISTTKLPLTND